MNERTERKWKGANEGGEKNESNELDKSKSGRKRELSKNESGEVNKETRRSLENYEDGKKVVKVGESEKLNEIEELIESEEVTERNQVWRSDQKWRNKRI